jgi:small-conductance mechanosensitive channel/CRP-like cAMP-binding protein
MLINLLKKLLWPTITLVVVLAVGLPWWPEISAQAKDRTATIVTYCIGVSFAFSLAWLVVRLIDVVVWRLFELRLGSSIPRLLKDLVAAVVFLIAGIIVVSFVFEKSVTGIWATSGALSLVVGFALKNMIADVFCGIALNVDRPFKIGQWIRLHPRGTEAVEGLVLEISWRSTRMRTMSNTLLVVPNSEISSMLLTNYSEPETKCRFDVTICVDFDVPAERALRVLLAGVKGARSPLEVPTPVIAANKVNDRGVEYVVRYWLKPAEVNPEIARHEVITSILNHLHQAGISLAYQKHDMFFAQMPPRQLDRRADKSALLKRVEIFSALTAEEMTTLAGQMKERRYKAGQAIVNQGEAGDSMYILVEGLLEVRSSIDNGQRQIKVHVIQPGEFFGEMSLLTGEPRSATVLGSTEAIVYEIGKEDLNLLLQHRPEMAIQISQIIAERRCELKEKERTSPQERGVLQQSMANQILEKMKNVFSSLRDSMSFRGRASTAISELQK